jgi:hypothetical protein
MDTDGGRRSLIISILFIIISLSLYILSIFYIEKILIISNDKINKSLKNKLRLEGYEIINKKKGVYLVQPVLYERD